MKHLKSLTNWRLIVWAVLYISVFFYFSCGGDEEVEVAPTVQESATFTVDATSREAWTYFSFAKGGVVEVADPANSMNWDLGFQRTMVKLNGGVSGPGKGRAVMLTDVEFNEVNEAPASGYAADSDANLAIVAQSEKGWYIYTRTAKSLGVAARESRLRCSSRGWNLCQVAIRRILQGQRE